MAQVEVFYDRVGNTLTVWFGEPQDEYITDFDRVPLVRRYTF